MLILQENICGDLSSETSQQDVSLEESQYIVLMRNKKNYPSFIIKYSFLCRALELLGSE